MCVRNDEIGFLEEFKVSIVIPVYNTEDYVGRAIESAICQTYSNVEIIIVNDGSTDNSAEICKQYMASDSRIKYFYTENRGVSAARNIGIEKCTGDFIQFLDSDDEMSSEKTEKLMRLIKKKDVDIVFGGYEMYKDGKIIICVPTKIGRGNRFFKFYTINEWFYVLSSACTSIIRVSVIKDNNLKFDENMRMGEDGLFVLDCLNCTKKIGYVSNPLYKIYKFHKKIRLSATGYFCYDKYKFIIEYFERINKYGKINWKKENGELLALKFFDKLIPDLILCYGYLNKYNKAEKKKIKKYLRRPYVRKAAQYYKRASKKDSMFIPLGIRLRSILLVEIGLNRKIKEVKIQYPEMNECIGIYKNGIER